MAEYLDLVRDLPLPGDEQRTNFVEYVSGAHSWYKHLPRFLPGAPFYFFLDRFAGCDHIALEDGSFAIAERKDEGFHYSDLPTSEYRTRFGHLGYACEEGATVFFSGRGAMALPRDKVIAIPGEDAQPVCLPPPLLEAGRVELTAVIHENAASPGLWRFLTETCDKTSWPVESGGRETLLKILKRSGEADTPEYSKERAEREQRMLRLAKTCRRPEEKLKTVLFGQLDPVLQQLIEPERARQKREMLNAINRVCALLHFADFRRL